MFKWMMIVCTGLMATLVFTGETAFAGETVLKTPRDVQSYGVGVNIAKSFKRDEVDLDLDLLVRGLKDGLAGEKLLMPERELRRAMNSFQGEIRQKVAARSRIAAEDNRKRGEAFLSENKSKDGVVSLASGVQYKVLKSGDGKVPGDADSVECNYRGTLLDGTEFDSTEQGKPATLKVSQLIPGWKDALKVMPTGSKWMVYIPSQLAYGPRGVGSDIGPNETLVFEVDLLAVK